MLTTRRAHGFTLTEALVALAILLASLVAAAALLLQTVRQERESGQRRAALRLATSMADHLRAVRRPDGRPALAISGVEPSAACADHPDCCAAELAAEQLLVDWTTDAVETLPQGATVAVTVPDPLLPDYLIAIEWPASGGGALRLELPVTT